MQALEEAKKIWAAPEAMIEMWDGDEHKQRHEKVISEIIGEAGTLVDLGCGVGRLCYTLDWKTYQGYDQSTQMINIARVIRDSRSNPKNFKVEFAVIDIFQFISDHSYDTLIMIDVAQHQQNPLEAIRLILKRWKAQRYFFTLLVGDKQEELLNSVVVSREDFQNFVHDNNFKVCYTESNNFDWVIISYEA